MDAFIRQGPSIIHSFIILDPEIWILNLFITDTLHGIS